MQRQRDINRMGERLLHHGYPRLEMAFLVLVTGLAGFIASFALLHAGVQAMMLRYPLAVGFAFIALLLQLWLWLKLRHDWHEDLAETAADLASCSTDAAPGVNGGGGTFDGGGASGNFDLPGGDLLTGPVEAAANAEEAAIPLFALIGIAAVALSMVLLAFSLVSTAPFLFAELLLDGAMSATLYRRLRHLPQRHWTQAVVRRTVVSFVLSAVLLAVAGLAMELTVPGAHTVGEFLHLRGQ
jgi:heme/copper-type cytochrome/quinol oxidase subunit 4